MLTRLRPQKLLKKAELIPHDGLQPLSTIMKHVLIFETYYKNIPHLSLRGFPFILIMFSQIKSDIEKC